jgi:hypothetical protein
VLPPHQLSLLVLPGTYAVCGLPADTAFPEWAAGALVSVTRTEDELSVVCREDAVPAGVRCEKGWRCVRVAGKLDFALVGVLASLIVPLAESGVSVFCLSTFDTDIVLVRETDLARTVQELRAAGHRVDGTGA